MVVVDAHLDLLSYVPLDTK